MIFRKVMTSLRVENNWPPVSVAFNSTKAPFYISLSARQPSTNWQQLLLKRTMVLRKFWRLLHLMTEMLLSKALVTTTILPSVVPCLQVQQVYGAVVRWEAADATVWATSKKKAQPHARIIHCFNDQTQDR